MRRPSPGLLFALAALVAGCGAVPADDPEPAAQPVVTAPTDAPLAVETEPRFDTIAQANWLTGEAVPAAPVLAVKIDNTSSARPQAGLEAADVVYVQEVEGGVTRLVAVFSTELPDQVGPVRSARTSDIGILGSYGGPALAFTGANAGVLALLRDSPLALAGFDSSRAGYLRDQERRAPYDVLADPAVVLGRVPEASQARDIGFRFGRAPSGGRAVSSASYAWPSSRLTVSWSAEQERWLLTVDDEPVAAAGGGRVGADTVVFQAVPVVPSPFVDIAGARSPEVRPIGAGEVVVLRGGRAWSGSWSRDSVESVTSFVDATGEPLRFERGQTWVVYVAEGESPVLQPGEPSG